MIRHEDVFVGRVVGPGAEADGSGEDAGIDAGFFEGQDESLGVFRARRLDDHLVFSGGALVGRGVFDGDRCPGGGSLIGCLIHGQGAGDECGRLIGLGGEGRCRGVGRLDRRVLEVHDHDVFQAVWSVEAAVGDDAAGEDEDEGLGAGGQVVADQFRLGDEVGSGVEVRQDLVVSRRDDIDAHADVEGLVGLVAVGVHGLGAVGVGQGGGAGVRSGDVDAAGESVSGLDRAGSGIVGVPGGDDLVVGAHHGGGLPLDGIVVGDLLGFAPGDLGRHVARGGEQRPLAARRITPPDDRGLAGGIYHRLGVFHELAAFGDVARCSPGAAGEDGILDAPHLSGGLLLPDGEERAAGSGGQGGRQTGRLAARGQGRRGGPARFPQLRPHDVAVQVLDIHIGAFRYGGQFRIKLSVVVPGPDQHGVAVAVRRHGGHLIGLAGVRARDVLSRGEAAGPLVGRRVVDAVHELPGRAVHGRLVGSGVVDPDGEGLVEGRIIGQTHDAVRLAVVDDLYRRAPGRAVPCGAGDVLSGEDVIEIVEGFVSLVGRPAGQGGAVLHEDRLRIRFPLVVGAGDPDNGCSRAVVVTEEDVRIGRRFRGPRVVYPDGHPPSRGIHRHGGGGHQPRRRRSLDVLEGPDSHGCGSRRRREVPGTEGDGT
ncbi:MAG: hypothetical protein BWX88_05292 [Planctomycetes bacterium ADurb.Bin126]|nr:MAG: hypothetical protein BWX88_05292 [Planctomycetes bacterium ADurb.Bin126]